jgi:hypothetical protein
MATTSGSARPVRKVDFCKILVSFMALSGMYECDGA